MMKVFEKNSFGPPNLFFFEINSDISLNNMMQYCIDNQEQNWSQLIHFGPEL